MKRFARRGQGRQILGSDPLGLVLLFPAGLAGWMRSWSEAPLSHRRRRGPTPALAVRHAPVAAATDGLLADMSLAHL